MNDLERWTDEATEMVGAGSVPFRPCTPPWINQTTLDVSEVSQHVVQALLAGDNFWRV
jgi:hypothetical protein